MVTFPKPVTYRDEQSLHVFWCADVRIFPLKLFGVVRSYFE